MAGLSQSFSRGCACSRSNWPEHRSRTLSIIVARAARHADAARMRARLACPAGSADFERAARRAGLERACDPSPHRARREANSRERAPAITVATTGNARWHALSFAFTDGQSRVAAELRDDLAAGCRCAGCARRRRVGEAALGMYACILAAESGLQAAFHGADGIARRATPPRPARAVRRGGIRGDAPVRLALGGRAALALARIASGDPASSSAPTRCLRRRALPELGLAVIDEQHRSAVGERQASRARASTRTSW